MLNELELTTQLLEELDHTEERLDEAEIEIVDAEDRLNGVTKQILKIEHICRKLGIHLPQKSASAESPAPLALDTIVSQDTARIDRELYLRLAREGVFPSSKVGKKVLAQWGNVLAAVASRSKTPRNEQLERLGLTSSSTPKVKKAAMPGQLERLGLVESRGVSPLPTRRGGSQK